MVKISKNGKRMDVPSAAYQNFYKGAGWFIVEEPKTVTDVAEPFDDVHGLVTDDEEVDDSEWDEVEEEEPEIPEGVEKPIAQMNHDELIEKAVRMGVDVSDNPNNKQLRERIRKHV